MSPRVPAGSYKVAMTKGKKTYKGEVRLINDPKSQITKEERLANQEATNKLYDMSEELAYMVYEIDAILAKAEEVKAQGGSKTADVVISELFALKEILVTTKGDNYVGAQKAQLRGDISTLYSKIAGSFQAPSTSELANLKLLEERHKAASDQFSTIKEKAVAKMMKYMSKKGIEGMELMSFEEFLDT